jgi:hypothetical protein
MASGRRVDVGGASTPEGASACTTTWGTFAVATRVPTGAGTVVATGAVVVAVSSGVDALSSLPEQAAAPRSRTTSRSRAATGAGGVLGRSWGIGA